MAVLNKMTGKRALYLARKYHPIVIQGYEHPHDIACRINFGPFEPPRKPVAYYWVRFNNKYIFLGYGFYHYGDNTDCPFGKLVGGKHRHDFEGLLIRVPYYLPHHPPPKVAHYHCISVCHDRLESFEMCPYIENRTTIFIEPMGHGIKRADLLKKCSCSLIYDSSRLISLDELGSTWFSATKAVFNKTGVHMPDQWSHRGKYPGWFWDAPDDLFEVLFEED